MKNNNDELTELNINNRSSIKLIQITDTHIIEDGGPSFNDYDTTASLNKVLKQIKKNESDADLILVTGDLVHEPTKTAYQKLTDCLIGITTPLYCIPGNHDDPEQAKYVMGANGYDSSKIIKLGNWVIILLDSCLLGEHKGELSGAELEFLKDSLETHKDEYCLIAIHHHPVSINSSWMDAMSLANADAFFEVVDQFKQVKAIVWGHIHQQFETMRNDVQLLGTPSTCMQFKPGSDTFAVDDKTPAYRKISLSDDGKLKTKVIYI